MNNEQEFNLLFIQLHTKFPVINQSRSFRIGTLYINHTCLLKL